MGKQWEKTVKERLKDIDVNSDEFKWLRPDLKVAIVVKAIETDFSELRKSGLYDVSQSRRVRDHVAIEIREKAMLLHNNAGLFDESAKMAKIASDIAGTESYKTQLQNEESQIQNTVKINDTGVLTLQVSGFLEPNWPNSGCAISIMKAKGYIIRISTKSRYPQSEAIIPRPTPSKLAAVESVLLSPSLAWKPGINCRESHSNGLYPQL